MATQLAEKIIKENIGDKQDTIIDNFINEIGVTIWKKLCSDKICTCYLWYSSWKQ